MSRNILLTGPPRCGKSTLIERGVGRIQKPMTGFFTREIRKGGKDARGKLSGLAMTYTNKLSLEHGNLSIL
jgi:nucleoside-triphosphatase THEP1